ncbi:(Fe-S)-binding protein [Chloroflexota bacterium]
MTLEDAVKKTNTYYCLECGKCSSICPVAKYDPSFSPRVLIENALLGLDDDVTYNRELFSCLTCSACSEKCPAIVDFPQFVQKARMAASEVGQHGDCSHAGILQSLMRLMANTNIKQNRLEWLSGKGYKFAEKGEVMYFVGCAPYFEPIFDDIGVRTLDIAEGTMKILNLLGIEPVVLADEKCCGHDMLWTGDEDTFKKLAEHNIAAIKEAGVKKIIFSCPEGLRTFKEDYPRYFDVDWEVQHISEFLAENPDKLVLNNINKKITYQDPCRLGRHLGVYESPRKVLTAIPGVDLIEMEHNRDQSICCGTSAWTNCDSCSKQVRAERLLEAKSTGADMLVTNCPKCLTHFKCAMTPKGEEKGADISIEVIDFVNLIVNSLEAEKKENKK